MHPVQKDGADFLPDPSSSGIAQENHRPAATAQAIVQTLGLRGFAGKIKTFERDQHGGSVLRCKVEKFVVGCNEAFFVCCGSRVFSVLSALRCWTR
jgi:hypothetical protein